jgi:murein endopeptidase
MVMKMTLRSIGAILPAASLVGIAFLAVSICAGVTGAEEQYQLSVVKPFQISTVSWKAEKRELKVEGFAKKPDSLVMVRDADTKALLGCAAVRADGKWMLKLRNPKNVPARMRVECDEGVKECDVAKAVTVTK